MKSEDFLMLGEKITDGIVKGIGKELSMQSFDTADNLFGDNFGSQGEFITNRSLDTEEPYISYIYQCFVCGEYFQTYVNIRVEDGGILSGSPKYKCRFVSCSNISTRCNSCDNEVNVAPLDALVGRFIRSDGTKIADRNFLGWLKER